MQATVYLADGRTAQADAVLQILKTRPDFAQATACATPALRETSGSRYVNLVRSSVELGGPAEWHAAIERLGQFVELVEPLDLSASTRLEALWHINRFQECDRQIEQALEEMWQGARGAAFARDYALGRVLFPVAFHAGAVVAQPSQPHCRRRE